MTSLPRSNVDKIGSKLESELSK